MKMLKKFMALAISCALLAGVAACGNSAKDDFEKETTKAATSSAAATTKGDGSEASKTNTGSGTKTPGKLVMGTNAEFPPFEFLENNEIVGIDPAVMALIAEEMGLELEIKDMKFDSLPVALQGGQIDIIAAGFTVKPDREESMSFSMPYYTAAQTVIVAKDSTLSKAEDLAALNVGVQSGTTGEFIAEEYVDNTSQIKGFANGMLAVEALKNGQVDAVIIDNNPARVYAQQNADTLKLVEKLFDDEEYAFAVAKGNTVLLDQVNAALTKIKEDGRFDEIVTRYMK